jgi:NAD(P)-dependent dehydrogenase (short-subunit alcohol dehydrogenase family)
MNKIRYDFIDEVVLITGAGQGIGEVTSKAFAEAGANLILVDKNPDTIHNLKKQLQTIFKKDILAIQTDVSSPDDVQQMVDQSIKHFGKIDVLFNNAGITKRALIKDFTFEDYRNIMKVNLDGVFLVAHTVGKEMIKRQKGKIINTASASGFVFNKGRNNGVYCISKAGVVMLTKVLAVEWAKYNIDVNAIAPGYTKTPINAQMVDDPIASKEFTDAVPLGRFAEPEEIAAAVLYLASPDTKYVIGDILRIDGGFTIW